MTFKTGDKVRYKSVSGFPQWAGLEGVVTKPDTTSYGTTHVRITKSSPGLRAEDYLNKVGELGNFITKNLERVKTDFAVGDRVKVVDYTSANGRAKLVGKFGTVTEIRNSGGYTRVRMDHDGGAWLFTPNEIEHTNTQESKKVTEFKKGDRVEFTEDYDYPVKKGDQGTVEYAHPGNHGIDVAVDGHRTVYVYTRRLKHVETSKFKVGDTVVIKGYRNGADTYWNGRIGELIATDCKEDCFGVRFSDKPRKEDGYFTEKNIAAVPVEAPTFKAGDRVTIKGYSSAGSLFEGKTGTIEHTYPGSSANDTARVQFDGGKPGDGTFNFRYLVPAEERKAGEFRVGDKVRVGKQAYTDEAWVGVEGIIEELASTSYGNHKVRLTTATKPNGWNPKPVGYVASLHPKNLTLIEEPKPFLFTDIQEGDTIKRTSTSKGLTTTREGVAHQLKSYYWATESRQDLAFSADDTDKNVTLELVNRPEPKPEPVKPKLTADTKVGDQILAKDKDGKVRRVFTKKTNVHWATLILNDHAGAGTGFPRTNAEVERQLVMYAEATKV